MAWNYGWYGGFAPYVPVAARKAAAKRAATKLERGGRKLKPVRIEGRTIARTFWGKAWCEHFEGLGDYANRLPRGRTYARNGSVIDLQVEKGRLTALVSGSDIYELEIRIAPLEQRRWRALVKSCAGKIESVVELLSGELSDGVMERLCDRNTGMFPPSRQLELSCSCPDGAWLCKHLAAVLYGVAARLDREPELLFVLRGVDQLDLVTAASGGALASKRRKGKGELAAEELSGIFGIELEGAPVTPKAPRRKATSGARRANGRVSARLRK